MGWARPGLGRAASQGKVDAMFLAFVEEELCKHQLSKRMARMSDVSYSLGSNELMITTHQLTYQVEFEAENVRKFGRVF